MLIFNPRRVFTLRGIDNPFTYLIKNGFIRTTASNLLNGKTTYAKIEYIEKLCILLNCTPSDLFEWKPDNKTTLTENHALHTLKRAGTELSFSEIVKDMPIEKVAELGNVLLEFKNK